jgi:hypothetical protein
VVPLAVTCRSRDPGAKAWAVDPGPGDVSAALEHDGAQTGTLTSTNIEVLASSVPCLAPTCTMMLS